MKKINTIKNYLKKDIHYGTLFLLLDLSVQLSKGEFVMHINVSDWIWRLFNVLIYFWDQMNKQCVYLRHNYNIVSHDICTFKHFEASGSAHCTCESGKHTLLSLDSNKSHIQHFSFSEQALFCFCFCLPAVFFTPPPVISTFINSTFNPMFCL